MGGREPISERLDRPGAKSIRGDRNKLSLPLIDREGVLDYPNGCDGQSLAYRRVELGLSGWPKWIDLSTHPEESR